MQNKENIQAILNEFAENVVRLARIELGARRKAKRSNGKTYYKVIDNTGTLRRSLDFEAKAMPNSFSLDISMEDYGEWVDQGRKKGKGAPPADILKWINSKPIRVRDANGSFVKATDEKKKSLAYLINRKIKEKGIEPTNFLTTPFNLKFEKLPNELVEAYALDVEDFLNFTIDKLNKKYKV